MEITKVVKPHIRRGANTFGNVVYIMQTKTFILDEINCDSNVQRSVKQIKQALNAGRYAGVSF